MIKIENSKDDRVIIKQGDLILTVDHGGKEELCHVMCIDNRKVWTKGVVDQEEICETTEEFHRDYLQVLVIKEGNGKA